MSEEFPRNVFVAYIFQRLEFLGAEYDVLVHPDSFNMGTNVCVEDGAPEVLLVQNEDVLYIVNLDGVLELYAGTERY